MPCRWLEAAVERLTQIPGGWLLVWLAPSQGERPSTPSFTAEFMTHRRVEATLMTVAGDLPDPENLAMQRRTCDGWIEASPIRGRA